MIALFANLRAAAGGANTDVRFGSKADICAATSHVRFTPNSDIECVFRHVCFTPKSGHSSVRLPRLLSATSGHSALAFSCSRTRIAAHHLTGPPLELRITEKNPGRRSLVPTKGFLAPRTP